MKIRAFTDGACSENPGPGGWGVVYNNDIDCETFSGYELQTTNNRMELTAVIECIKIVCARKSDLFELIDSVDIFSDSAYVVNAINNRWIYKWMSNGWKTAKGEPVKNKDLWDSLCLLLGVSEKISLKIHVIKIKGHSGNTFNELVDKLAKEETQKAKIKLLQGV